MIKDLDCLREACNLNDINFNWDTLKLYGKNNVYLGKLIEDKKDEGGGGISYILQTDSDFVGSNARRSDQPNMNRLMMDYSETLCRRRIGSVGTILERTESERGVLLKVAVG